MTARALLSFAAVAAFVSAQGNSLLPRGDTQLTQTLGVIQSVAAPTITDVGFPQIDIASPHNFVAAAGGNVATPQLAYALFPELVAGAVELQVKRSLDGGRNWEPPVTVYTVNTAGGEDLNTGDKGTYIFARGNTVYVTLQTNAHNLAQNGQSLWVVASEDQGQTWSPPLNVSTGWNRPVGNRDWDVDNTRGVAAEDGLFLVWEADFENPANPGTSNTAPNNNENAYFARVEFSGGVLTTAVPEMALTSFAMGTNDVNFPMIDAEGSVALISFVDNAHAGLAPGARATVSLHSFDSGATWSAETVHSGLVPGTYPQQWAQPRRPWPLVDGGFAFLIHEDSRSDEDDVWMDRADINTTTSTMTWSTMGVRCNNTSVAPGSGDVDGIIAAASGGVLAILYRDDSAGVPLNNSNEAYLVVDSAYGFEFQAGTHASHQVTTGFSTIFDLEVVGNVIVGVYEGCHTVFEEGGIVLSHDRGATIDSFYFTELGGCGPSIADIDDLKVSLTQNGDFNVIYVDNRLGSAVNTNANNASWVTGGKFPRLTYDSVASTMTMDMVDPSQSGAAEAFLMLSFSTNPGTDLNAFVNVGTPGSGNFVGLNNDLIWVIMWSNVFPFIVPIDTAGTATWTAIPNVTALFGVPIYVAGGTFDFGALPGDIFRSYTDPILQ